jgi:prephenate dehydrogenase
MTPNRITILGLGLLGGSVGLTVRKHLTDCTVVGYSINGADVETALRAGAIHFSASQPGAAVANADLVILCTPVSAFPALLQSIAPHLEPTTIVTDVGSTKQNVIAAATQYLPSPSQFVPSHPMAGSENQGIAHARADLFDNATCVITPTPANAQESIQKVESFWKALHMRTVHLSPEIHDQYVAQVSHLPHALAAAMVNITDDQALDVRGKGFLDFTRIASGDGALWEEILRDNRGNVLESLDQLTAELGRFRTMLAEGDTDAMKDWLNHAAQRRRDLAKHKPTPSAR